MIEAALAKSKGVISQRWRVRNVGTTRIEHVHCQAPRQFLIFTLVAATVAASAAAATEALTLEVWAMTCLWLGIGLADRYCESPDGIQSIGHPRGP